MLNMRKRQEVFLFSTLTATIFHEKWLWMVPFCHTLFSVSQHVMTFPHENKVYFAIVYYYSEFFLWKKVKNLWNKVSHNFIFHIKPLSLKSYGKYQGHFKVSAQFYMFNGLVVLHHIKWKDKEENWVSLIILSFANRARFE